jgi:hypothetical protein
MQRFPVSQPAGENARRKARLTLTLTSLIFGLLLIPGLDAMRISSLAFYTPHSETNPGLIAFAVALISYPVLAIVSIPGSWVLYVLKRYSAAILVSLLPLLSLLAAFLCFLLLEI